MHMQFFYICANDKSDTHGSCHTGYQTKQKLERVMVRFQGWYFWLGIGFKNSKHT